MIAFPRSSAPHGVSAIVISLLASACAYGQSIDFAWSSAGTFTGSPSSGTVATTFTSSAPFALETSHATYTGQAGATRTFGPFEIIAAGGDKLFGSFEVVNSGPIGLGMNLGSGSFTFTGGTGQFSGATGQGDMEVKTTLTTFPTNTGSVEQQWQGMITLVPATVPGDYNHNGTADAADYIVWRNSLGETGAGLTADGDGSGAIDELDYAVWRANFGAADTTGMTIGTSIVPEPPSFVLAVAVFAAVVALGGRQVRAK
jgi:hypothetical protein